jgi:hypothetical protein
LSHNLDAHCRVAARLRRGQNESRGMTSAPFPNWSNCKDTLVSRMCSDDASKPSLLISDYNNCRFSRICRQLDKAVNVLIVTLPSSYTTTWIASSLYHEQSENRKSREEIQASLIYCCISFIYSISPSPSPVISSNLYPTPSQVDP